MKNIQLNTPGFVLTSMSYKTPEMKKAGNAGSLLSGSELKSSIAKFDYCLPPSEQTGATNQGSNYHQ